MPNTQNIGLDTLGIELDARGYVKVDVATSAANVWAMGDCAGSPQFTHVAFDDFRVDRHRQRPHRRLHPRWASAPAS